MQKKLQNFDVCMHVCDRFLSLVEILLISELVSRRSLPVNAFGDFQNAGQIVCLRCWASFLIVLLPGDERMSRNITVVSFIISCFSGNHQDHNVRPSPRFVVVVLSGVIRLHVHGVFARTSGCLAFLC